MGYVSFGIVEGCLRFEILGVLDLAMLNEVLRLIVVSVFDFVK